MTTTNSARQEKYRLDYQAPHYLVDSIDLDVHLDDHHTRVVAISRVHRQGHHNEPLVLDGEALHLTSVHINGLPTEQYVVQEGSLVLPNVPAEFVLTIETEIDPAGNTALEGLYKSGSAFCTQCEAEGFRRITYYLDRPDVLAKFTTRITADKARYPYLLSNGNRISSGDLANGQHWVSWQDPFPKPCYLFALVAGDFDVLRDTFTTRSGRAVNLELYVDKGNLSRSQHAMNSLKQAMRWDETRFGLEYDLDIYMIVAVDFFNMGAMENKGLNIFNSKFVLANPQTATDTDYHDIERVIGHEYFHNWTGNRITCRDWFQLSLKEGLTVFRDQEFSSDLGSRAVNRIRNVRIIRGPQFAEDAGPMAHPIRPDVVIEMNNFYTVTVYEKGSEVIRMLHTLLGEAAFQAGMRIYVAEHDGEAATCEDFIRAMETASGRDLAQFRRWYSQAGTPILTVRDEFDASTGLCRLHFTQLTPPTAQQTEKRPLHIPVSVALYTNNGQAYPLISAGEPISHVLELTQAEQTFVFEGISDRPIVALLQDFSAPVKLNYAYRDEDLLFLLTHAENLVCRWDAGQKLIDNQIQAAVQAYQAGLPLPKPTTLMAGFQLILQQSELDKALVAEILTIPSESTLAEQFEAVDIDAIHAAREDLLAQLAVGLQDEWARLYLALGNEGKGDSASAVAARTLRNLALQFFARADQARANDWVQAQYDTAVNMTNTLAAMHAASGAELPALDTMLADYDQKWQQDGLVMDHWFRLQAGRTDEQALPRVRQLMQHPAFSLQNPNRVRALIGTFAAGNPVRFHAADGSGYQFLRDVLIQLNQLNPQVAARLIVPMIQFQRLDTERRRQIRCVLTELAGLPNLARDLYEKIERALAQPA